MKNQHRELNELGWSDWFEQRAECGPTDTVRTGEIAKAAKIEPN